jgi:hypothetical protein
MAARIGRMNADFLFSGPKDARKDPIHAAFVTAPGILKSPRFPQLVGSFGGGTQTAVLHLPHGKVCIQVFENHLVPPICQPPRQPHNRAVA